MKHYWALFGMVLFSLCPVLGWASYYDQVQLPIADLWPAAVKVISAYGLNKENPKKALLESKWNYDEVDRSRGMFKNILKQRYKRRYRLRIQMEEKNGVTDVTVTGVFQERYSGTDAGIPWKTVKRTAADHAIEREVFFKMLTQTEADKKAAYLASIQASSASLPAQPS